MRIWGKAMARALKIVIIIAGGLIALFAIATMVLFLFVDTDAYRAKLEATASKALGMEVRVDGALGMTLLPSLHITLEDVHLTQQGTEIASAEKVRLGIDLFPLLQNKIRIGTFALKHPRISIERDLDGKFNYQNKEPDGDAETTLGWSKVSLSEGTLIFSDQQSGAGFEASNCSLIVDQLRPAGWKVSDLRKNLSFTAELACREMQSHDLTLSAVNLSASGKDGVIDLSPVTMQVFGAQGVGSLRADFAGETPIYVLRYELPAFRIEEFFKLLSPQPVATGTMDFSADLSAQGKTLNEIRPTIMGNVTLHGENIQLLGRDLDEEFSHFESSQNFNLVDVGAFFFAGPLGLLVTKGYNFASNLQGSEGSSEIRTLVSDWQVERSVANARDVALATGKHRVALQGGLDLANEKFNDLTLALIDADGCAKVRQKIRGSFLNPEVEPPNFLKALAGPVTKVLKMGRDLFPGGECEPFYTGSVASPK